MPFLRVYDVHSLLIETSVEGVRAAAAVETVRTSDPGLFPLKSRDHLVSAPNSSRRHPRWLRQTKRLFPHPLFAGCISLAFLLVGILFTAVTINVPGCWLVGIPSALFFLGSYAAAAAAITPSIKEPVTTSNDVQTDKPTFAILVLLVSIFSWQLEVLLHFLDKFCKNGPSPMEYFITLGLAISSTLYMQVYGKRIVRKHFGAKYGTKLELSSRQAVYVTIFVVSFGIYIAVLRF